MLDCFLVETHTKGKISIPSEMQMIKLFLRIVMTQRTNGVMKLQIPSWLRLDST